jgi:hypothetical protein
MHALRRGSIAAGLAGSGSESRWAAAEEPLGEIRLSACDHSAVRCLNHYDTFRKYECLTCGDILMCECERELALAFLPHQVRYGTEFGIRKRYPVTRFAPGICAACRGESEAPHPKAATWDRKGKVERFYWREIQKTYFALARRWLTASGESVSDILDFKARFPGVDSSLRREAREHWKTVHRTAPKYDTTEETEASFLADTPVPTEVIDVPYVQTERGDQQLGKWLNATGHMVSAEAVAVEWYEGQGYRVLRCERALASGWVATLLARVIQDSEDPRQRMCFRQSTVGWRSDNRSTPLISFSLPEDFGSAAYFDRRRTAIESELQRLRTVPSIADEYERCFDASEGLRDYLWAAGDPPREIARTALGVLPGAFVLDSIDWVIRDFWNRLPGWPDILAYRDDGFLFAEVKSPHDKLSQEQMNWFRWAINSARVPCEILRVRRAAR